MLLSPKGYIVGELCLRDHVWFVGFCLHLLYCGVFEREVGVIDVGRDSWFCLRRVSGSAVTFCLADDGQDCDVVNNIFSLTRCENLPDSTLYDA